MFYIELTITFVPTLISITTGTFSHAYEEFINVVRKEERNNPEKYTKRNEMLKKQFGHDIPPLPDKYEHEQTSLIMVDFLLANLGKM